jgi:hypothetical protein
MLTKEMVALELVSKVESAEKSLKETRTWCEKCAELEAELGKSLVNNRWQIGYSLDVTKQDLPAIRKVVGRLTMTGKRLGCDTPGKETVIVRLEPMSKDWKMLAFEYPVRYRAGKCQIVEQSGYSYKTLVCSSK